MAAPQARQEFQANRAAYTAPIVVCALFALGLLIAALVQSDQVTRWVILAFAALSACLAVQCIVAALDSRPIISVAPEGLTYRWFSPRPIPWPEITAISLVRHFRYGKMLKNGVFVTGALVSGKSHVHIPFDDTINFALADYSGYPRSMGRYIVRGMNRAIGAPAIAIQVSSLTASAETILAAIAQYWGGQVAVLDIKTPGVGP